MNKHQIIIIPKIMNSTLLFVCEFNDPVTGTLISLIDHGKYGRVVEGKLGEKEAPKQIPLNIRSKIEYEIDMDNLQDQALKNHKIFWTKHPFVQIKGEKDKPGTQLLLEDITETKAATVVGIKDKRKATQKFEAFGGEGNLRGWRNIAYYFGVPNADKLGEDDLYITLIEPSTGILVQPENIQRFLKYNSNDFNTQLAINTTRAIEKKFIEKKSVSGAGDSFFINNHPVGKTEADVIVYLEANKDFYSQFVVEKLGDDAEQEKQVKAEETNKNIETVDINGLRATAKERYITLKDMDVKGAKVAKYAQLTTAKGLQEAIEEADQLISERSVGKTGDKLEVTGEGNEKTGPTATAGNKDDSLQGKEKIETPVS